MYKRQGQQIATIQTPQAKIKVDGTVFRMEEKPRSGTTISMTEGKLFVNNGVSSLELLPGQRLSEVKYLDELSTKLENMKTQIFMNLTPEIVDLSEFTTQEMTLTLQLADLKSGKISITSPLARSLIGKDQDDVVELKMPSGITEYEIVKVDYE